MASKVVTIKLTEQEWKNLEAIMLNARAKTGIQVNISDTVRMLIAQEAARA